MISQTRSLRCRPESDELYDFVLSGQPGWFKVLVQDNIPLWYACVRQHELVTPIESPLVGMPGGDQCIVATIG
jgi:hypothetical protein